MLAVLGDDDQMQTLPKHIQRHINQTEDGCWKWTASKSPDGYGWASLDNKTHQAHRLVYRLIRGEPGDGLVLDHLCRVRHCVNPDHMEPVTPGENIRRGDTPAGWDRCQRCGGEFSPFYRQRRCLPCNEAYEQGRREAKRLAARAFRELKRGQGS